MNSTAADAAVYSESYSKSRILVVEDLADIRFVLEDLLSALYEVHCVSDGAQALDYLMSGANVDLVLLDVVMPGINGFEVCEKIKSQNNLKNIPVLFLTELTNGKDESKGLAIGGADFIHKPVCDEIVLARVKTHLQLAQARMALEKRAANLEQLVSERTQQITEQSEQLVKNKQQLIAAQDATIKAFCTLAEARDNETGNHILRTQHYIEVLAKQLQTHPDYKNQLDNESINLIFKSAPLHDIGKVAIPDAVLLKPGKLNSEERTIIEQHCKYGYDAINSAINELGETTNSFLRYASEIALSHHERWDGNGYPHGLSGKDIPLSARLMAVADVYDALISERVYKPAFSHVKAMDIIIESSGTQFDPSIIDALIKTEDKFCNVAKMFSDKIGDTGIDS